MEKFNVPCERCNEFASKFAAEGFVVHGCNSDPAKPGMCVLEYDEPTQIQAVSNEFAVASILSTNLEPKDLNVPAAAAPPTPQRYVNVSALNLRATPSSSSSSNVLRTLALGQLVEITGVQQNGWWPVQLLGEKDVGFVRAVIDGTSGVGTPTLREPVSDEREALVAETTKQWALFKYGQGKETVDPFYRMIGDMWNALELPHTGRDDLPWSAAFISYVVRHVATKYNGYDAFVYAASHSVYIHDAIKRANVSTAPFHGFRLFERKPQIGDMVARSREDVISFEQAATSDAFKSHTDIIVAVHADGVYAIGGNVSNSVNVTQYAKTAAGYIDEKGGVFALLVNNV